MNIIIFGDIVGRHGREWVLKNLPIIKKTHRIDAAIVNVDNASGGFGITTKHAEALLAAGADVLTGGDHIWDQKDITGFIGQNNTLLRPINFPPDVMGKGELLLNLPNGQKLLVLHALGQVFHKENLDCPFTALDNALKHYRLGGTVNAIVVDMHCEATSEKMAMGAYLDGRVSAVVGTHTHVPTADARILPQGTAYQTDLGMCGAYDSIIGFDTEAPLVQFTKKHRKIRMTPASQNVHGGGLIITTDDKTGLAKAVKPFNITHPID